MPVAWAKALGGVLIGVPMPPTLAAKGMANAKATRPRSSAAKSANTGATIANIIAVMAVLLINMENIAVISIIPSSTQRESWPKGRSSTRAKLTSNRYLVAATAKET